MRGGARRVVFYDTEDKLLFCKTLTTAAEKFNVKIFAYAIMDNHVHILLQCSELSKFMASFLISFVKRYNSKNLQQDCLFGKRFGSSIKNTPEKLKQCLTYILANPLEGGLCTNINDYRWTSLTNTFNAIPVDDTLIHLLFENKNELLNDIYRAAKSKQPDSGPSKNFDNRLKIPFDELTDLLNTMLNGRKLSTLSKQELFDIKNQLIIKTKANYSQIAKLLSVSYKFVLYNKPL